MQQKRLGRVNIFKDLDVRVTMVKEIDRSKE